MEEATGRPVRTVRTQGMEEADLQRLAAFLRLGGDRLHDRWELASGDACDVLLMGSDETLPMDVLDPGDGGPVLLRIVDAGAADGSTGQLTRPLAYDDLLEQLERLEARGFAAPAQVRGAVPRDDAVAAFGGSPSIPLRPFDLYRLRSRPSEAVLAADPRMQAVASLLTIRPTSLEDLVARSLLSSTDCEAVLRRLGATGLLQTVSGAAPVRPRTRPASRPAIAPRAEPEPAPGLLARWRERLGRG